MTDQVEGGLAAIFSACCSSLFAGRVEESTGDWIIRYAYRESHEKLGGAWELYTTSRMQGIWDKLEEVHTCMWNL